MDPNVLPFASPRHRLTSPTPALHSHSSPDFPLPPSSARNTQCRHCSPITTDPDPVSLPSLDVSTTTETTFPKAALANATILRQVDRKYIACVLNSSSKASLSTSGLTLVLIDQHAADERVSIETILHELCEGFANNTIEVAELTRDEPKVVLTRDEAEILARPAVLDVFRRWGFDLVVPSLRGDYVQVAIKAVPRSFIARLGRKQAVEMTRLIKLHLPVLDISLGEQNSLILEVEGRQVDWGRVLRWMPKEMLELANSKACRGMSFVGRSSLKSNGTKELSCSKTDSTMISVFAWSNGLVRQLFRSCALTDGQALLH